MKDPYKILGVDKSASLVDIKLAFRIKAKTAHPDKGGDKEAFHDLEWAYSLLKSESKREEWDLTGTIANKKPSLEEQATAEIMTAFSQWLLSVMQGQTHFNGDCIAEIESALENALSQVKQGEQQLQSNRKKIEKMHGNFSCDNDQPNFFEGHLDMMKATVERNLEEVKSKIMTLETALEKLTHFTYSPEEGLVHLYRPSSTVTGGSWNLR